MKIEFTKEQYKNLVIMNDLANSVLGILGDSISGGKGKKYKKLSNETEEIENYLLSFAESFECGHLTEKWRGETILNEKIGEKFQEIMNDFEDFILFDSLANKLAWRDFKRIYSREEMDKMEEKNGGYFGVELYPFEKKYWDEFENNDLERLEIREDKKAKE